MAKLSLKNMWNKQTIFLLCVLLFALIYCCIRMTNASYFGKPILEGNTDSLTVNDLDTNLSSVPTDIETTPTGIYLGKYQLTKTNNANLGGEFQGNDESNHQMFTY